MLATASEKGRDAAAAGDCLDKRGRTTTFAANTLDNWRDVRHVFEAWGILLRERLQQAGVCRKQ